MDKVIRVCGTCAFYTKYEAQPARCKSARDVLLEAGYTIDVVETYCVNDATECPYWKEKSEPQCIRCKYATYHGGRRTTCSLGFEEQMAFRLRLHREDQSSKTCDKFEHC